MSIPIRLEKLWFPVTEMDIAFHLSKHAPDDFIARTLARHIAVRAENFIEHARALRKPLNVAGFDTKAFHTTKENYAKTFEEYFPVVRDKLGAHVQDFDFGKRIELWNEIEVVKISYFVDGAREIYDALALLGIPGYVAYSPPPDLSDAGLTAALESFRKSASGSLWAEIGVDPLSMTRANSSSIINTSPIHARAGQLALIRRWIKSECDLLARVSGHTNVERVLRARIITDVVSFFDCLVTRPVSAGAPQQMDGLNTLLQAEGKAGNAIDGFVNNFATEPPMQRARSVRDHMGGHLEIDDARPLPGLLTEIDTFDLSECLEFYRRLENVFEKACREVIFLRLYVADGQRMYGVSPGSPAVVSYDEKRPAPAPARPQPYDFADDDTYRDNLERWLMAVEPDAGDARHFFWQAFLSSPVVEQIPEVEDLGGGSRYHTHEFRKAHTFILDALQKPKSPDALSGTYQLLLGCRSGAPYALSEVLVRYSQSASGDQTFIICYCLGELAGWPHKAVDEYLRRHTSDRDFTVRFHAVLALFKIYFRSEGLSRVNRRAAQRSFEKDIAPLLSGIPEEEKLVYLIAFASQFCAYGMGSYGKVFSDEYTAYQSEIETLCDGASLGPILRPVAATLHQLLQTHDYVGVCLLVADHLQAANVQPLADTLLGIACAGWVVVASHKQALRHRAACFLRKGEYQMSLELAEHLASQNVDDVALQVFVAQVLASTPGAKAAASKKAADIRAHYKLAKPDEEALQQIDAYLEGV